MSTNTSPEGWRLMLVNQAFDDLMYWLERCDRKGHLENCSDLIEPWNNFDYQVPAHDHEPEAFVRSLLWDQFPECCGNAVVGAQYMGQNEMVCCGCPEPVMLSDAQIVASLRERFKSTPDAATGAQP